MKAKSAVQEFKARVMNNAGVISIARIPHADVVRDQVEKASKLYGHPTRAARMLGDDLERMVKDGWTPSYKRESKDLVGIINQLMWMAQDDERTWTDDPARLIKVDSEVDLVPIPKVFDPLPSSPIEQAFEDYLNNRNQVKDGRWRYHIKSLRGWNTTLCPYDKDEELRRLYPLTLHGSFPDQFRKDACAWRANYRKPQQEKREEAIQANFGETMQAIERFEEYINTLNL